MYLAGSHTWPSVVDRGETSPPEPFDFEAYLRFLRRHHMNFARLWTWELPRFAIGGKTWYSAPQPWPRTGPGTARDGLPKFDLRRFDETYFDRLRSRVMEAGRHGVYVSVMLFEGWGVRFADPPTNWEFHPFNRANNVNGIDGDANGDGSGIEVHAVTSGPVLDVERAYVERVVDAVADRENVLFEVANEAGHGSTDWQHAMVRYLRRLLDERGTPRPVGMTSESGDGDNAPLVQSGADWVSPGGRELLEDPPAAGGAEVSLLDTDHVCGLCGGRGPVWRAFLRGHNVLLMDDLSSWSPLRDARRAIGQTSRLARRLDLAHVTPQPHLASAGFCLAAAGSQYVVYQPTDGAFTVDLSAASTPLRVEWLEPATGRWTGDGLVAGGARRSFEAPFSGDAVLFLRR